MSLLAAFALSSAGCCRGEAAKPLDAGPVTTSTATSPPSSKPASTTRGVVPKDAAAACRVRLTGKKSTYVGQPALEIEIANQGSKPFRMCGIWTYAYDAAGKQIAMDNLSVNSTLAPGETALKALMVRDETTRKSIMDRPDLVFEPVVGRIIFADDLEWEVSMPEKRAKGSHVAGTAP